MRGGEEKRFCRDNNEERESVRRRKCPGGMWESWMTQERIAFSSAV